MLGEGALLAALRRSRGPRMRDIVTTIQREQDEAIRAPARGVTLITGGPGTGKTQVALHRAAYLLYTDRGRFADGGVLVVGPSTVFTAYISRVLPALGEDSVHLRALGELVDGVTATRRDAPPVAEIKGSDRMREVLAELIVADAADRARPAAAGVRGPGADAARRRELARVRSRVRTRAEATATQPNAARPHRVSRPAGRAVDQSGRCAISTASCSSRRSVTAPSSGASSAPGGPRLTPTQVLSWLADPARVSGPRRRGGRRSWPRPTEQQTDWSVDDVPLLDELDELLGEPPRAPAATAAEPSSRLRELTTGPRRIDTFALSCGLYDGWNLYAPGHPTPFAVAGPTIDNDAVIAAQRWAEAVILREGHRVVGWTDGYDPYGEDAYVPVLAEPLPVTEPDEATADADDYAHVILDEAQDLSPMECRMIARRAQYASMTIVGDLGQATHPLAAALVAGPAGPARPARRPYARASHRIPGTAGHRQLRRPVPRPRRSRRRTPTGAAARSRCGRSTTSDAALRQAVREAPHDATTAVIAADRAIGHLAPLIDRSDVSVRPGQPGQGPRVRPRHRGRAGRDHRRRTPRLQPAVRGPHARRRVLGGAASRAAARPAARAAWIVSG